MVSDIVMILTMISFLIIMASTLNLSSNVGTFLHALYSTSGDIIFMIFISVFLLLFAMTGLPLGLYGTPFYIIGASLFTYFLSTYELSSAPAHIIRSFITDPFSFFTLSTDFIFYLELINWFFMAVILFRIMIVCMNKREEMNTTLRVFSLLMIVSLIAVNTLKYYIAIKSDLSISTYAFITTLIFFVTLSFENLLLSISKYIYEGDKAYRKLAFATVTIIIFIILELLYLSSGNSIFTQTTPFEPLFLLLSFILVPFIFSSFFETGLHIINSKELENKYAQLSMKIFLPITMLVIANIVFFTLSENNFTLNKTIFISLGVIFIVINSIKYFSKQELYIIMSFTLYLFLTNEHSLAIIHHANSYLDGVIDTLNTYSIDPIKAWTDTKQELFFGIIAPFTDSNLSLSIRIVMMFGFFLLTALGFIYTRLGIIFLILFSIDQTYIVYTHFGSLMWIYMLDIFFSSLVFLAALFILYDMFYIFMYLGSMTNHFYEKLVKKKSKMLKT
jgi:hypothetical protein